MLNKEEIMAIIEKNENEFEFFGIRFENKEREVGEEITDYSRNNLGREDERDFPQYETEEYWQMEEMDGISTWDIFANVNNWLWSADSFVGNHAYIIAGNKLGDDHLNGVIDDGELVINDGVVIAKLY